MSSQDEGLCLQVERDDASTDIHQPILPEGTSAADVMEPERPVEQRDRTLTDELNEIFSVTGGRFPFIRKQTTDDRLRRRVETGRHAAERTAALVRELLAFTWAEKPKSVAPISKPFFRIRGTGQGRGPGLPMVNYVLRHPGGVVVISGKPDEGAKDDAHAQPSEKTSPDTARHAGSEPGARGSARILLVDDDESVREITVSYLEELHYTVVEADSAESAYGLMKNTENIDLVVTDIVMPGADGLALAARLRTEFVGLPIVFITGYADGHDLCGEMFLAKPFDIAALARFIKAALNQEPPGTAP